MNRGLVTNWYERKTLQNLLKVLEDGDLLEFKRQGYCHWAVYVGVHNIRELRRLKPCVIHLSYLAESEKKTIFIASYSVFSSFTGGNVAPILMEPVEDVLFNDKVRINNDSDNTWHPYPPSEVVARAENYFNSPNPQGFSLMKNNCEHFANRCRYGREYSGQVISGYLRMGTSSLGVALSTAQMAAVVASPLALASTPLIAGVATLVGTAAPLMLVAKEAFGSS